MALSEAEIQQLGALYEMPVWKIFRKHFLEDRQLELAQFSTFVSHWDLLMENRGKVVELRNIEIGMAKNYKKSLERSNGKAKPKS